MIPRALRGLGLKRRLGYYRLQTWYRYRLKRQWRDPVFGVTSIPKSGTTYFRMVVANYLELLYGDGRRLGYDEMKAAYPNRLTSSIYPDRPYRALPCDHPVRRTPYTDFLWDHMYAFADLLGRGTRMVYLFRNPLDSLISHYHYFWLNRPEKERVHIEREGEPISDVFSFFPYVVDDFATSFVTVRDAAQTSPHILRVSYESLMIEPLSTFTTVFDWYGLVVSVPKLRVALEHSSRRSVKEEEEKKGAAIHAFEGFVGSFIRSGKVGEWQDVLSQDQVEVVRAELGKRGVSLDEFRLTD